MAADGVVNFVLHKIEKPFGKGATREMALTALDKAVDQYQGIGVSHLFWNVNYQRVGYDSAAWPSYWDMPDPEKQVTEWPRTYYELHKLGIDDVFARLIASTRERGISPWVSLRMNDHHYTGDPSRVSPLLFNHPELRHHKGHGLFNYARPEVREHYLKLVSEVLQRYDVDGLELDWIRTPSNFDDGEIGSGRAILTEFVREVRRRTQSAAQRLGHPVRLAVRVPTTPEFSLGKGFEVVASAKLVVRFNGHACSTAADLPVPSKPDPRPEQPRHNVCEVARRVMQFDVRFRPSRAATTPSSCPCSKAARKPSSGWTSPSSPSGRTVEKYALYLASPLSFRWGRHSLRQ